MATDGARVVVSLVTRWRPLKLVFHWSQFSVMFSGGGKINLNGLTFVFWNKWTYFDMAINQAVWLKSLPETDCWIPWRLMLESLPVTRFEQKQTDWSPSGGITDCLMGWGGGGGERKFVFFQWCHVSKRSQIYWTGGHYYTLFQNILTSHYAELRLISLKDIYSLEWKKMSS